jgi:hypothetical protein
MMFAQREDVNILDDDHVFTFLFENSIVDHIADRLLVAFGEEEHRLSSTLGRLQQTCQRNTLEDGKRPLRPLPSREGFSPMLVSISL